MFLQVNSYIGPAFQQTLKGKEKRMNQEGKMNPTYLMSWNQLMYSNLFRIYLI